MNFRPVTIVLSVIASALLLYGIPVGMAYDYYIFLRWVIMAIAVYSAFRSFETENKGWGWVMVVTTVLFNPIIQFYFSKGTWVIIDIVVALLFVTNIFILKEKNKSVLPS